MSLNLMAIVTDRILASWHFNRGRWGREPQTIPDDQGFIHHYLSRAVALNRDDILPAYQSACLEFKELTND